MDTPPQENLEDNTTVINNTINKEEEEEKQTLEVYGNFCTLWTKLSIPLDKIVHTPMDKIVQDNNTVINNTANIKKKKKKSKHWKCGHIFVFRRP